MSGKLRVLAPDLRETGVFITFDDRAKGSRQKVIKITTNDTDPDSERSANGSGGAENAIPNDPNDPNDCSGLLIDDGDAGGIMGRMMTALSERFPDDPELPAMLDQLCELTDLLHEQDEHPIELAARMAFEKVIEDRERERGAA